MPAAAAPGAAALGLRLTRDLRERHEMSKQLAAAFIAALMISACRGTGGPTQTPPPAPTSATITQLPTALPATNHPTATAVTVASPSPVATTAATPTSASISVTGDDGKTVTLPIAPQKVISLTPATTELMFALGAGDRLAGRTDYDNYPAEVSRVPAVATFQGVEMEKVVNIGPDLVLAGGNNFTSQADIDKMRQLGFPVLVLYAKDVPGVLADISLVGQAVGETDAATQINASIQARIDEVETAVATLPAPRTFYEIGNDPELYGPAPDSFVADEVTLAGGNAITTADPSVFSIPLERLVSLDPEVIVLGDAAYGVCPSDVASRAGWKKITAVVNDAIVPVDDTIVTRPGPRIGEGLAALALAIHPDAQITAPADLPTYCSPTASPTP